MQFHHKHYSKGISQFLEDFLKELILKLENQFLRD